VRKNSARSSTQKAEWVQKGVFITAVPITGTKSESTSFGERPYNEGRSIMESEDAEARAGRSASVPAGGV
jgi:hypothetical protein